MARYIDVDALWKDVTSNIDYCADFLEIIERQPTVTIKDTAEENKVTNCNDSNDNGKDVIYRQDAIDTAVTFVRRTLLDSKPIDVKMSSDYIFVNLVEPMRKLPSVQPETNCSEFPNNSDTISRQAAIDALDKRFDSIPMEQTTEILLLRKDLRDLPSAQPERPEQPESAWEYCAECDHIEMCRWYPYEGCEFRSLPSAQPDMAENLYLYKCYITDKDGLQHEVIHTGDIRRVTGWEI